MRLGLIIKHGRRILMQFDPTKGTSATVSSSSALKRPYSNQATAAAVNDSSSSALASSTETPRPAKLAKTETTGSALQNFAADTLNSNMKPSNSGRSSRRTTRAGAGHRSSRPGPSSSSRKGKGRAHDGTALGVEFDPPLRDANYLRKHERDMSHGDLKAVYEENPKSTISNFCMAQGSMPVYESVEGHLPGQTTAIWRTTVKLLSTTDFVGMGDHPSKKESEKLAALSALYQLHAKDLLGASGRGVVKGNKDSVTPVEQGTPADSVVLSDGTIVTSERARQFMDYYCRRYKFGKPDVGFQEVKSRGRNSTWEATMTVGGRRIGLGAGSTKRTARVACFLDVTQYLESCDPELWKTFAHDAKTGRDLGLAPKVLFQMSEGLEDEVRDLCYDIRKSTLYHNRPSIGSSEAVIDRPSAETTKQLPTGPQGYRSAVSAEYLKSKSDTLKQRRQQYLADPKLAKMRETRASLPVYTREDDLFSHIQDNEVTICLAATGSGKTTQIPQMILDRYIERGEGATCNILCTQPRRIAAISVADRVAKERGEVVGRGTIGYQVRFDSKLPEEHGSITFCTTGIFLRRMQSALSNDATAWRGMDEVTHVVVDEVHERDVDTDLLLVVLKRLMAERKARKKPLKVVLMSATIDPTLFQQYFPTEDGRPAGAVEIPGRSFPVEKHFLEDFIPQLASEPGTRWVFSSDQSVSKYLQAELDANVARSLGLGTLGGTGSQAASQAPSDLELPVPLVALTISHVLRKTDSGHVLVFLPGWEDIVGVQRCLLDPQQPLGLIFNDSSKFNIHLLHSTIPLAEQQIIFEPPPEGVRRIILATNIAETSVTIPDVVYVVDAGKVKEQRYDPERRMSALVSAWVGKSNLNQRAGRAGRHRPGEYYGILGKKRAESLHPYQTVEMKRVDLSNIVMHVKALDFPGMAVEEVLAATIEPPDAARVAAAMKDLIMVGALDQDQNLTSLGRVLLQLPVEVQMGKLVLLGSFFRCLDGALTLAAILTNRDPFVSPMHLKQEASQKKNSWSPQEFRSDALATLQAFNAWWAMQSRGDYVLANRFCSENFLSKPTLLMIQKIKTHLLQSLYAAGVVEVSAGGRVAGLTNPRSKELTVPPELNENADSLPLLAALIAVACQPKFAIRTGEKTYRTSQDKVTFIHPSSVNFRKRELPDKGDQLAFLSTGEKQLFAFVEKRQNISTGNANPQMYLVTTTRLDPMTYLLFGAYKIEVVERGLECDGWLPMIGNVDALDDLQRLKTLMESCMLRVFEGLSTTRRSQRPQRIPQSFDKEDESESEDDGTPKKDPFLSQVEVKELDLLTRDIVRVLNRYSDERIVAQSRHNSRPATPMGSPASASLRLPGGSLSGHSTPYNIGSAFNSRPNTPSRLSRRF